MLRPLALAFLSLIVTFAAEAGTSYRDPGGRFAVTVPDGWQFDRPSTQSPLGLLLAKQDGERIGLCMIIVLDTADTRNMSQAELDEEAAKVFTKDYWRNSFTSAGATDVNVEEVGSKDQNGRKAFFAVASASFSRNGVDGRSKSKQVIHLLPGSVHAVMCLAKEEVFPTFAGEFEIVFDSYVPASALVAMGPGAPSSTLTLFTGARYDGMRRVLMQSVTDLPQLGWSATASLAAVGPSAWQICEGFNYSGRCSVIRSGGVQSFGARAVRIGSARRLSTARIDPRPILGAVHQATGMNLNTALRALAMRRR